MTGDDAEAEPAAELVLPFVVTQSVGGPYDDDAYTAGWEMGSIDAKLSMMPAECDEATWTVRTANVPQLDLVAMRWGWKLGDPSSVNAWPDWRCVTLKRFTD